MSISEMSDCGVAFEGCVSRPPTRREAEGKRQLWVGVRGGHALFWGCRRSFCALWCLRLVVVCHVAGRGRVMWTFCTRVHCWTPQGAGGPAKKERHANRTRAAAATRFPGTRRRSERHPARRVSKCVRGCQRAVREGSCKREGAHGGRGAWRRPKNEKLRLVTSCRSPLTSLVLRRGRGPRGTSDPTLTTHKPPRVCRAAAEERARHSVGVCRAQKRRGNACRGALRAPRRLWRPPCSEIRIMHTREPPRRDCPPPPTLRGRQAGANTHVRARARARCAARLSARHPPARCPPHPKTAPCRSSRR